MTNKTKLIFLLIIGLAVGCVIAILSLEALQIFTLPTRGGVNVDVKVAVAPDLEMWVRDAASDFNERSSQITVNVVSLKGLDASNQLATSQGTNLADAWIAEADFIRQMAGNNIPYQESGPSIAQTQLVWVTVAGRSKIQGLVNWDVVSTAAQDVQFRAALPSPVNSVEGVAAYLSAAAFFHKQANLNASLVGDQSFKNWMDDILLAVAEKNRSPFDQLTRPPVSVDLGLLLENDLVDVNANQLTAHPLEYTLLFNFPFLVRTGNTEEDAEARTKAVEDFKDFLLKSTQQEQLINYGFQTAESSPSSGQLIQVDGNTVQRLRVIFQ